MSGMSSELEAIMRRRRQFIEEEDDGNTNGHSLEDRIASSNIASNANRNSPIQNNYGSSSLPPEEVIISPSRINSNTSRRLDRENIKMMLGSIAPPPPPGPPPQSPSRSPRKRKTQFRNLHKPQSHSSGRNSNVGDPNDEIQNENMPKKVDLPPPNYVAYYEQESQGENPIQNPSTVTNPTNDHFIESIGSYNNTDSNTNFGKKVEVNIPSVLSSEQPKQEEVSDSFAFDTKFDDFPTNSPKSIPIKVNKFINDNLKNDNPHSNNSYPSSLQGDEDGFQEDENYIEYEPPPNFTFIDHSSTKTSENEDVENILENSNERQSNNSSHSNHSPLHSRVLELPQNTKLGDEEYYDSDWDNLLLSKKEWKQLNNTIYLKSFPFFSNLKSSTESPGGNSSFVLMTHHPWNGNLIVCRQSTNNNNDVTWSLEEIYPPSGRVIHSTSNLCQWELFLRQVDKYGDSNSLKDNTPIYCPVSIAAGVHRQQGHSRVRVAILFQNNSSNTDGFVAVWQWGYAPGVSPVALQSVLPLSPPSDTKHQSTDMIMPSSLCVADGLLFLATSSSSSLQKKSKILIAKPQVRYGWSTAALFANASITTLAVTMHLDRKNKYLAVAMDNGTLGVYTYDLAVTTNRLSNANYKSTNILHPLCQLKPPIFPSKNDENHIYECTHFEWLPSTSDNIRPFMLLAATFENKTKKENNNNNMMRIVSVYHVALPFFVDLSPPPATSTVSELSATSDSNTPNDSNKKNINKKNKTSVKTSTKMNDSENNKVKKLAEVVELSPIMSKKLSLNLRNTHHSSDSNTDATENSDITEKPQEIIISDKDKLDNDSSTQKPSCCWLSLGPRISPCIAVTYSGSRRDKSILHIGALNLPLHAVSSSSATRFTASWLPLWEGEVNKMSHRKLLSFARTLIINSGNQWMGLQLSAGFQSQHKQTTQNDHSNKLISESKIEPMDFCPKQDSAHFSSLTLPVSTNMLPGLDSHGNILRKEQKHVLHVYTLLQSQQKSRLDIPERRDWSVPVHRHFLCRTNLDPNIQNSSSNSNESSSPSSASHVTSILCELTCGDDQSNPLIPHSVKESCNNDNSNIMCWCVVLFTSILSSNIGSETEEDKLQNNISLSTISPDPIAFAVLQNSVVQKKNKNNASFKLHHGRDAVLLEDDSTKLLLVLGIDGLNIYSMEYLPSSPLPNSEEVNDRCMSEWTKTDIFFRALSYSEAQAMYVRRLHLHMGELIFVVQRYSDGKNGLINNGRWEIKNCKLGRSQRSDSLKLELWMESNEEIMSIISLQEKCSTMSSIAILTTNGVKIVDSSNFSILAQVVANTTCTSLIPLGHDCVAFSSRCPMTGAIKVKYLSCLSQEKRNHCDGIIASIPSSRYGSALPFSLFAIRPDRFLYICSHSGNKLMDYGKNGKNVFLPMVTTRPVFLLEPLVANALCGLELRRQTKMHINILLKDLFEKFGRKSTVYPYQEKEGPGVMGTGLSVTVYELLDAHQFTEAGMTLLFGKLQTSNSNASNIRILPQWLPMEARVATASNQSCQNTLHSLACGDLYLSEYLAKPSTSTPSQLPRTTDISSMTSNQLALRALQQGNARDAIKYLDFAGSTESEHILLHTVLSLQLLEYSPLRNHEAIEVQNILENICGQNGSTDQSGFTNTSLDCISSIASLANNLKERKNNSGLILDEGECGKVSESLSKGWMRQLAPTVQKEGNYERSRARLLSSYDGIPKLCEEDINNSQKESRTFWLNQNFDESKHIWSKGPNGNKENLLLLNGIEEWLGRCRPTVVGREGAELAAETGTGTLADILAAAKGNYNRGQSSDDDSNNSFQDGWIDGIGEGRNEEDNLSAYFRFAEGADEDNIWRSEGIMDLSAHQQKANVICAESISIEATTSYVDEGESGKVKLLHDLVFNDTNPRDCPAGLCLEVKRGSSLDVGMLHDSENRARQRLSIEFWYHLPRQDCVLEEIVLVRRSICFPGEDFTKLCAPSEKEGMMWELVVLPSGWLEFRTCSKSVISSYATSTIPEKSDRPKLVEDDSEEDEPDVGLVGWEKHNGYGGWNHVCVTFSSRNTASLTDCVVSLYMKGSHIASDTVSIEPPGLEPDQLSDINEINVTLEKTALMFGVGAAAGFRITEIRGWACERSADDIKLMMYEYLQAAETKKKIKVIIRNKDKGGLSRIPQSLSKVGKLKLSHQDDSKAKTLAAPPASSRRRRGRNDDVGTSDSITNENITFAVNFNDMGNNLNSEEREETKDRPTVELAQTNDLHTRNTQDGLHEIEKLVDKPSMFEEFDENSKQVIEFDNKKNINFFKSGFSVDDATSSSNYQESALSTSIASIVMKESAYLSKQVRTSAAAAIVRGPPATRHFGGNRGGLLLPPSIEYMSSRNSIGPIAICGAEKTVIYTYDQSPPGKTYPIGASGAIVSDIMDASGSEYLCCFLAKDKRMVVFELHTKTVVVELQMTTKLNFWRYLPPSSHGNTLVYMLITPVGGFHWMPLNDTPRPRQTWKRGLELQGKKIISYEEGGHNGKYGADCRSKVALILTSTANVAAPVEAWCLEMFGDSPALCLSPNILGAALLQPTNLADHMEAFDPYIMIASQTESEKILLEIFSLTKDKKTGSVSKDHLIASTFLDLSLPDDLDITEPAMAMGTSPPVLCLYCQSHIAVIIRSVGAFYTYQIINNDLNITGKTYSNRYVIDAAIKPGIDSNTAEVVALMCENGNPKNGKVVTFTLPENRVD